MQTDRAPLIDAETQHAEILALCGGNEDAASLIEGFWGFCEVWDDAIDGEKNESDQAIHKGMMWALFELNDNPFYLAHPELRSALQVCIAEWMAANELERNPARDDHLHTAYVLRCSPYSFFAAVVLAASGHDAAVRAAYYFRSQETADNLSDYVKEHKHADS